MNWGEIIAFVRAKVREILEIVLIDRPKRTIEVAINFALPLLPSVGFAWLLISLGLAYVCMLALAFWAANRSMASRN